MQWLLALVIYRFGAMNATTTSLTLRSSQFLVTFIRRNLEMLERLRNQLTLDLYRRPQKFQLSLSYHRR
jgi:hypothetical protein